MNNLNRLCSYVQQNQIAAFGVITALSLVSTYLTLKTTGFAAPYIQKYCGFSIDKNESRIKIVAKSLLIILPASTICVVLNAIAIKILRLNLPLVFAVASTCVFPLYLASLMICSTIPNILSQKK